MNIEFREPSSILELESLFRLRQTVYSNDDSLGKMVNESQQLDVNAYDLNSWHFGAFLNDDAIANIRLTVLNKTRFSKYVNELLKKNNINIELQPYRFPFQQYYPDKQWSENYIDQYLGKRIGEVGKLAIIKDFRHKETFLDQFISAFLKYCIDEHQIETGFGSCTPVLERYYRKYGFFQAEGASPFIYKDLPEAMILQFDP